MAMRISRLHLFERVLLAIWKKKGKEKTDKEI